MSQNVQHIGPYKVLCRKENPGGTDAHLSLKIFASKAIFTKIMVPRYRRYMVIWNNTKNSTGCRASGSGEDFGISKTFWTLRHCPGAFWKQDFLF